MRLVRCRKCGAFVMADETMLENMYATLDEINQKALKAKGGDKNAYIQQAAQITKLIKQANHRISLIEEKSIEANAHLTVVRAHLLENGLMTAEEFEELCRKGDERAEMQKKEYQKELERIFGTYRTNYSMSNQTKRDNTANAAIRNAEKRR